MTLEIITPDKIVYSGQVSLVQVPGTSGSFEILNNHAPIISTLEKGQIRIVEQESQKEYLFSIEKGFVELNNNKIVVLLESAGALE
ncbi:MAG: ATP synthase F1 subunit epsilon [Salinivirgaceae bacterium]|nr:ATP synthase F1 subunit epsilon [Salinivirgaceae bacterium]